MKRILALIAVIMLTIAPFTVEAADLNVTFSLNETVTQGSRNNTVMAVVTNNSISTITKAIVSIESIGEKTVGVGSGFRFSNTNATAEVKNLEPGKPQEVFFYLDVEYGVEPGSKKVAFKMESEGLTATGEGTIRILASSSPPPAVDIKVTAEAEAQLNTNFVYVVKIENPGAATDGRPTQSMQDVKVELLEINGEPILEYNQENADKYLFGYVQNPFEKIDNNLVFPFVKSGDPTPSLKVEIGDSIEAGFHLAFTNKAQLNTYKTKVRISWKSTNESQQEKIVEGSIKVSQVQWYTYAVRWFIDAVRNTVGFKDYGVAIIIFAIVVKLLFWPLTNAQFKNMAKMAKIQPMINELKRKYPGNENKQKLQEETLRVYKENNVNLLSGCLPLLIQLPIIMALYSGISQYAPLNFAKFLWLPSLGFPDKIYIMAILLAASTWFQQKVSTMPGQDEQSATFQIMFPAIIFLFGINFPSGISLYWFMFNFATIVHQMIYNKAAFGTYIPTPMFKQKAPVKETKNVK